MCWDCDILDLIFKIAKNSPFGLYKNTVDISRIQVDIKIC